MRLHFNRVADRSFEVGEAGRDRGPLPNLKICPGVISNTSTNETALRAQLGNQVFNSYYRTLPAATLVISLRTESLSLYSLERDDGGWRLGIRSQLLCVAR